MPRKQRNEDDDEYSNDESKLLKKEIDKLKKELKIFKRDKNEEMIAKYSLLIASKEDEREKIIASLFEEDLKGFSGITLHKPRQAT